MRNRLPGIILAALSAVTIAGCTTTSAGTPMPDPTSSTEDTSSSTPPGEPPADNDDLPSDGAPKVTDPFDASHFEQNPCDALTPVYTDQLNVPTTGQRADTNFGKGCSWRNPDTAGGVVIAFTSTDKRGLSSAYRSNENGEFAYFEPVDDIEGHPAVAYHIRAKDPKADCSVSVGITDQLTFATYVALSAKNIGHKDPCEQSAIAAGMAMKTMQGES